MGNASLGKAQSLRSRFSLKMHGPENQIECELGCVMLLATGRTNQISTFLFESVLTMREEMAVGVGKHCREPEDTLKHCFRSQNCFCPEKVQLVQMLWYLSWKYRRKISVSTTAHPSPFTSLGAKRRIKGITRK